MLKISGSLDLTPKLGDDDNEIVKDGNKADNKNSSKKTKNTNFEIQTHIGAKREPTFLTPGIKEIFNQLRQAFTKARILRHFDLECHIWIETNPLGNVIRGV